MAGCEPSVDVGGKELQLLRGEFHRHTEYSSHRDRTACWKTAGATPRTPADLDWMGDGDHDNGFGYEYMWWHIQKMTDLHSPPARFRRRADLRAQRWSIPTATAT